MKVWAKSERLKKRRLKLGLSGAALAAKLELTATWWNKIENGRNPTSAETAKKVCNILDVGFDDVFDIRKE